MPAVPSVHEVSSFSTFERALSSSHDSSSTPLPQHNITDPSTQPCLLDPLSIPPRRRIAHLRGRPVPRRRRTTSVPRRRRRNIIPIVVHGTIVASPRWPSVVSPCVAVVVSAAAAAAVMVMMVVTAGVRGAVVVGVAVAGSSRVMPGRFCNYYQPGVNHPRNKTEQCEEDVNEE
jgi:hypothetical protein